MAGARTAPILPSGPARSPARIAIPLFAALLFAPVSQAACVLAPEAGKGARPDESAFQHESISPGGFFALHWNSEGDSAFAADLVQPLLAAFDSSLAAQESWGAPWSIPLGERSAYPVYMAPLNAPGATSVPYEEGGQSGLTWIQLDNRPARWSDAPQAFLEVTAAHELFHARQFARAFDWDELAFYEASAVWAEDRVYPDHDDWADRYLPAWLEHWDEPLNETGGLREYGAGCVVKYLLAGGPNLGPLWHALDAPAWEEQRGWSGLLEALVANPLAELLGLASERLRAGRPGGFRVPELAAAEPLDLSALPAPLAAAELSIPPPVLAEVGALSIGAVRLPAGRLRANWFFWPGQLAARQEGLAGELVPLDAADTLIVAGPSTILLKANALPFAQPLLTTWQALGDAPALLVWPNPGGRLRTLEFAGVPRPLILHDILGRTLWTWTPSNPSPRQTLLLPGRWRGPLFLASEDGSLVVPISHWPR